MGRRVRYIRRFLFSVYLLLQSFWSLRCCWIYTRHWSILPPSLSFHPPGFSILHKDGSLLSPMLPASYRARSLDFRSNVTNASSPARQTRFALSGCCRFLVYITSFFFSFLLLLHYSSVNQRTYSSRWPQSLTRTRSPDFFHRCLFSLINTLQLWICLADPSSRVSLSC